MPGHLLVLLGNAFIVAYALDAGFSLLEEIFRQLTGSQALLSLRNHLAGIVIAGSAPLVIASVLSPRLPPSVIWPLALSALWGGLGAAPLPLLFELPTLGGVLVALQLALAAIAFLRLRALAGGRSWLLRNEAGQADFSIGYSAAALAAVVVGGMAFLLLYLPLSIATSIQLMTDEFVRFDLDGVELADRRYQRDDQELRLVAMMHIGERDAYQALIESFSGTSTVILAEGVTDRSQVLKAPISYQGVARALGLDTQDAIEAYLAEAEPSERRPQADLRHADVDMSEFHPDTITWLGWAGEVWNGEDTLGAIAQLYTRYNEEPDRWAVFAQDVLERRNLHLLEELVEALTEYERVIVPWGALHLPFLQNEALKMGFEPAAESYHRLASWNKMATALLPE